MEAQLQVEEGASPGSILMLAVGQTKTLGRGPGADLVLDDPALVARHVAVRLLEDGMQVVDLGGGTRLNDAPLPSRRPTNADSGDLIRLGSHAVRATLLGGRRRRRARKASLPFPPGEFSDVQRVGSGASGKVYRAQWVPRGHPVALKLLREEYASGTTQHTRFLRECQTMARIQSPFVVGVFDVRSGEDSVYIVMELVEGAALDAVLAQGALSLPRALRIAEDVAWALAAAAAARVIHRDVKPANVLLDRRAGVCRLCDFGLAKDLQGTIQSLTAQGQGLGTLAYLPPEQVSGARRADSAADVYSLGATLFHALAGRPPFLIDSESELDAVLAAQPPRVETLRADVPGEVADMLQAMLAKSPDQRPSAQVVAQALAQVRARLYPGWDPRLLFAS
jgi:serine/threonine protein kinase